MIGAHDILDASLRLDAAMLEEQRAVAQHLDAREVVRDEHDRAARALEFLDELPELAACLRIEAGRRLVEKQQLRIADERAREREPLLLAARQRADARAPLLLELHEPDDVLGRRSFVKEAAEQADGFFDRELFRELRLLKLNAEPLLQRFGVGLPVEAEHLHFAGVALREALADLDRRRLAGAVRAQQPEAFAGLHLEVEAAHGYDVFVRLTKIADAEHRLWHGREGSRCGWSSGQKS